MMRNFKNEQSGRSMIEMLGVLAIIGVLSVGGIAGYSKAMHKYRINKAVFEISQLAQNIRTFFYNQKDYSMMFDQSTVHRVFKKANLAPDEMWDGDDLKNVFGWSVTFYRQPKSIDGDNKAFIMNYPIGGNIEACIELLSYDWSAIGGKVIYLDYTGYFKTPMDINKAIRMCSISINYISDTDKAKGMPRLVIYFDVDVKGTYWSSKV